MSMQVFVSFKTGVCSIQVENLHFWEMMTISPFQYRSEMEVSDRAKADPF